MTEKKLYFIAKTNNTIDTLDQAEHILQECNIYYQNLYQIPIDDVPLGLRKLDIYNQQDPLELVESARLFDVKFYECYLFWILRYYCCIPLPEFWNKSYDPILNHEIYCNTTNNMKITIHPAFLYISTVIQTIRSLYRENQSEYCRTSGKLALKDKLNRDFEVDLGTMINEITSNSKSKFDNKKLAFLSSARTNLEIEASKKKTKDDSDPSNDFFLSFKSFA